MKIVIKQDASSICARHWGMHRPRYAYNAQASADVSRMKGLEGKTLEVETKYLFNDQYNTAEGKIMGRYVEEVIDDERPNRQQCEHCGEFYVLADEKHPDHCRHCYAGRPDVLLVCKVVRAKGGAISWVESTERFHITEGIEYVHPDGDTRKVPAITKGLVDGKLWRFVRVPTYTINGKNSKTFYMLTTRKNKDGEWEEWAVMASSSYSAVKGHYFEMSAEYAKN